MKKNIDGCKNNPENSSTARVSELFLIAFISLELFLINYF